MLITEEKHTGLRSRNRSREFRDPSLFPKSDFKQRAPDCLSEWFRFGDRDPDHWRSSQQPRCDGSMGRSVSLAAARERNTLLTRAPEGTGDAACRRGETECVMRGTMQIGERRGHADSCVMLGPIGRWAWSRPPSRCAIGRARATKWASLRVPGVSVS